MEYALLAQAQVPGFLRALRALGLLRASGDGGDLDLLRVRQPKRQLVAVDPQLHGVAQRGVFHKRDLRPRDHAHVQEVLPQRAVAAHGLDPRRLADLKLP